MSFARKAIIVLLVVAILAVFSVGGYAVYRLGPLAPLSKHSRPATIAQQAPDHVYSAQTESTVANTNGSKDNSQPISAKQASNASTMTNASKSDDVPTQLPPQVSSQQLQSSVDSTQLVAGQVSGLVKKVLQQTTSQLQAKTENLSNQLGL